MRERGWVSIRETDALPFSDARPALPWPAGSAPNVSKGSAMPGETSFERFLSRSWAAIVLLALVAGGAGGGLWAANALLGSAACVPHDALVTGWLSFAAGVLSLAVTASKEGLEGIAKIGRAAFRGGETIRLLDVGNALIGLAAASVLFAFSSAIFLRDDCSLPPKCSTKFEDCRELPVGAECQACNAYQEILGEVGGLKEDLQQLKLHRVGAFPLLFDNARPSDDELTKASHGIKLPKRRLEQWKDRLFGTETWPLGEDVGYCVVGYSSEAPFRGRPGQVSDDLNLQAANYRAANFAKALSAVPGRVAKCKWLSYDAIVRPRLLGDEHLSDQDGHLISRSAFAHAVSLAGGDGDLGSVCPGVVAERTDALVRNLRCLEAL